MIVSCSKACFREPAHGRFCWFAPLSHIVGNGDKVIRKANPLHKHDNYQITGHGNEQDNMLTFFRSQAKFLLQMATDSGEWPLIPGNGRPQAFPSKRFLFTIIEALGAIQRLRQWPKSTNWPFCGMGGHFQRNTHYVLPCI